MVPDDQAVLSIVPATWGTSENVALPLAPAATVPSEQFM